MHTKMPRLAAIAITVVISMGARPGMAQEKPAIGEIRGDRRGGLPRWLPHDRRRPCAVPVSSSTATRSSSRRRSTNSTTRDGRSRRRIPAFSTPNSDTPYSMALLDLRAEPFVLCVPEIEKARYYDVQLVDLYTDNYGYIGSRATGHGAGCFLVAGPGLERRNTARGSKQGVPLRNGIQSGHLSDAIVLKPCGHGQREKSPGRLQGAAISAFLGKPAPPAAPEDQLAKIRLRRRQHQPSSPSISIFCCNSARPSARRQLRSRCGKSFCAYIGIGPGKKVA